MALGAVADMAGCREEAAKIINKLDSSTELIFSEVKRGGMEACRAKLSLPCDNSPVSLSGLTEKISSFKVSDTTLKTLERFLKTKAEARSVNPENAKFILGPELCEIYAVTAILELLSTEGVGKVCLSGVYCSDGVAFTDDGFVPVTSPETGYIAKKYDIKTLPHFTDKEIFTEGGAALLAALEAQSRPTSGRILKIGYGAGECELETLPNILRAVLGEEGEEGLNFEAEKFALEFSSEILFQGI